MSRSGRVPNQPYLLLVRRFFAFMVDAVIVATLLFLVGAGVAQMAVPGEQLPPDVVLVEWAVLLGIWIGYWAILVGRFHATVGQRLLRLRVAHDGAPISVSRQLLRCVIAPFAFVPLALGYVWAILDPRFRSLVDNMTDTSVLGLRPKDAVEADSPPVADGELSDATGVAVTRVTALADALATSGHWQAAGAMLRVVGNVTGDRNALAGAAWAFARSGDLDRAFAITKYFVADPHESSPLARAAHALALATSGAPADAAATWQGVHGLPDEVEVPVEVELALSAKDYDAADARVHALTRDSPDSVDAWLLATRVARARGDREELQRRADGALRIAPIRADARAAHAAALSPRKRLVPRLASSAELSALVAVLDVDPFSPEARRRLRAATTGQRRAKPVVATVLGLYGIALATGFGTFRLEPAYLFVAPILLVTSAYLAIRYLVMRSRLTPPVRPWVGYLDALASATFQQQHGRHPAPLIDAAPPDSVLRTPARCWCTTLEHTSGESALDYVHAHLLEAERSPAGGVFVFRCPQGRGAYVGMDGQLIDDENPRAELYRVEPRDLETVEPDVPIGMYL